MKNLIIIILLFQMIGCASHFGEGWTRADTNRQIAYSVLHIADWSQTHDIIDKGWREINPLMPEYPTHDEADLYIGGSLLLQTLISPMLKPAPRRAWQRAWIGIEAIAIGNNLRFDVGFAF